MVTIDHSQPEETLASAEIRQLRADLSLSQKLCEKLDADNARLTAELAHARSDAHQDGLLRVSYGQQIADLRLELAQAREVIDRQFSDIEQPRASLAASMRWIPISEADLLPGEEVDLLTDRGTRMASWRRSVLTDCAFEKYNHGSFPANRVTHILRIKPPAASKGESHEHS